MLSAAANGNCPRTPNVKLLYSVCMRVETELNGGHYKVVKELSAYGSVRYESFPCNSKAYGTHLMVLFSLSFCAQYLRRLPDDVE